MRRSRSQDVSTGASTVEHLSSLATEPKIYGIIGYALMMIELYSHLLLAIAIVKIRF